MRIHTDWKGLPAAARGATVAMGNFDGVHLGHRAVIDMARGAATAPLGVILFEPHPREIFNPTGAPFRLMNRESRANRLQRLGVDQLYELPFSRELAALSPEAFAREILRDGLGVRHVTVGADFCFGRDRAGDAHTLEELGRDFGFGVSICPIQGEGGRYSSSAIRSALAEGRPQDAARMLGHWHRIEGEVLHGDKRGRDLGFPTANMTIDRLHPPAFGIYAVLVDVLSGPYQGSYKGVSSIGVRPTFGENKPNLETFIFDFKGDLYGEHLSVALVEYLRPELRFTNIDELIAQMKSDSEKARAILADH